MGYLFSKPDEKVNIKAYARKHDIVRQTARKDLNELINIGLIKEEKEGKNILFSFTSKEKLMQYIEK